MKVATIQTTTRKFFHYWINVTAPLHNLGKTEKAVLSELLYYRYKLSEEVVNDALADKLLFSYDIKVKIGTSLNITPNRLALVLSELRKNKIIVNNAINKAYIPEFDKNTTTFIMAYRFRIKDDDSKGENSKEVQEDSK